MNERDETEDLVVLGDATALTRGDFLPGGIESMIHPDHYDPG